MFTQKQVKRVHQYTIEDTYSRRNIREEVERDIGNSIDSNLVDIYNRTVNAITLWLNEPANYTTKAFRKQHIRKMVIPTLVTEMFIAIAPHTDAVPIQNIATKISAHLEFDDVFEGITAASELIGVCVDAGLYDVYMASNTESMTVRSLITLEQKTLDFIDKTMYLNPMLCVPTPWKENKGGGYLSIHDSLLLGKDNYHEEPQALDALNIMQCIEWELDDLMVNYMEMPNKELETEEAKESFQRMTDLSNQVYQDLMDQGNSFYFVWKYDFRGRMYSQGYYINLQSTSYKKSLLNFAKRQLIQ